MGIGRLQFEIPGTSVDNVLYTKALPVGCQQTVRFEAIPPRIVGKTPIVPLNIM